MKIDSNFKTPAYGGNVVPAGKSPPPAGAGESAAVHLSPAARLAAAESAPVNAARIAEIKQAIAEGSFRINPKAIADSLIKTARELVESEQRD